MDFERRRIFERINVVGTSGSGKTTLARQLAAVLDVPCYEIDELHWQPDWQPTPTEELNVKLLEATSQPGWVLDGNYLKTTPIKWQRVQLVVWLDLSFARTISRVTRRSIRRAFTREELWPGTGNRESVGLSFFSRNSVIWWAMTSYRDIRRTYEPMMESPEYAHIEFVRLRTPREVREFLASKQRADEPTSATPTATH